MRQLSLQRWHGLLPLMLLLGACTGVSVKETTTGNQVAYQARAEIIAAIPAWRMTGRISLDDGSHGGSGKLQWMVKPEASEIDFHGAMGRGAWHLQIDADGAVLKSADGSQQAAADVDALVEDRIGWPIPVDALKWWVRGLAAPGRSEEQVFDAEGLLINLRQFGWRVDFNRYDSFSGLLLPTRLEARRDDYRVKLAIGRWQMETTHAHDN